MFRDIVIPKNNEQGFIDIAEKLDIKKLYFLYDFSDYDEEKVHQKIENINSNIEIGTGLIVNPKNLNKASKLSKLLVAKSSDKDRILIESKKIRIIYGFEEVHKKDYLYQRMSGLNHVLCELAKKNNVSIGFSYSSLFDKGNQAPLLIGRMMQNIALCKKYKVKMIVGSFSDKPLDMRAPHNVIALFAMLGTSSTSLAYTLPTD
ncbi:hypothetical protein HYX02_07860 [Candidatus Woesearchaeota archaeon]|nr:hypothetical protein [Candidatus Woesearchaeota archaeon]